ncbi:MAG: DUF362 domain-containing protein [Gemmatimonadota bacterium]
MHCDSDKVYLYRTPVEGEAAPFDQYRDLARRALGQLDLELPATGSVLINPNITISCDPDSRIITHPGFAAGIVEALIEKGVAAERLVVVEGHGGGDPEGWARATGYEAALAPYGLRLVDLNVSEGVRVPVPGGVVFASLEFAREVTECAYYVNAPVAKCHNLIFTTLCMKNTQGTVKSPQRHMCGVQQEDEAFLEELGGLTPRGVSLHEERFCHKQSDLIAARRILPAPRLCVVDGLIGRDGTGFREGTNRPLGWTLIGGNEVHVDTVGTYLMGLDPARTPYLQVAAERGLGTCRIEGIEVVDLHRGRRLTGPELAAHRSDPVLMPLSQVNGGYVPRFLADGTVVPWALDRVNEWRAKRGQEPLAVPVAA